MYFTGSFPIVEKKSLGAEIYSVKIAAPDIAAESTAGQFANVLAPGFTLRRPISICDIDNIEGTVRFVFEVRGEGTKAIANLSAGDTMDVVGPLGNGFDIPEEGRLVLVGGGIGVPPLYRISKLRTRDITAILGFRSYDKIFLDQEFRKNGNNVILCTDDGSVGRKGLVTEPLAEELDKGGVSAVMACGPAPMLRAVADECKKHGVKCQVSLEQRMGCGVGACVVCSCMTVRDGEEFYSRVCKDGPVFDAEEVKF